MPHGRDAFRYSLQHQSEASAQGFDWPGVTGVLDKIGEELGEIRDAVAAGDAAHARRELGDLLLAAVNAARFLGADPACELEAATDRFSKRVAAAVALLRASGRTPIACAIDELDAAWNAVKCGEKKIA